MICTAVKKILFSLTDIETAVCGTIAIRGDREVSSVVIDSRKVTHGSLFVPLLGTKTDGHMYIKDAFLAGAAAALCSRAEWENRRTEFEHTFNNEQVSIIIVENTLSSLQSLAKYYMKEIEAFKIGVTGSNGKTTTKEIIGSILRQESRTTVNEGNLNSEIGLPLSAFQVTEQDNYAVFEMGMNHKGEMNILSDIIRPDYALITNIGSAHIGLLGSIEAIAEEKKKVFQFFNGEQKAFLFEDEEYFQFLTDGVMGTVIPFGPKSTKGYEGSEDLGLGGSIIHWEGLRIHFPLFGSHNLKNALASISVSAELKINKRKIKSGLESVEPLFGRSQILEGPVTVIQDCYNSNPDSLLQVLEFFKSLNWKGRKIAVLGSMLELGDEVIEAHKMIGSAAAAAGFKMILFFGDEMEPAFESCKAAEFEGFVELYTDFDKMRCSLLNMIRTGDLILLKSSRSMELERLVPYLLEED